MAQHFSNAYLVLFVSILVVVSSAGGNYGYGQQPPFQSQQQQQQQQQYCDHNGFNRARETIRIEIQQLQQNQQQQLPPYDPRYSGMTNAYQPNNYLNNNQQMANNDHKCKLIRQSFDQLVKWTPLCESVGSANFESAAQLIIQARTGMKRHCENNQGWQFINCFKRNEIIICQNNFQSAKQRHLQNQPLHNQPLQPVVGPYPQSSRPSSPVTYEFCRDYEIFKNCTTNQIRTYCYASDQEYTDTYLVDQADNVAWSCIPQSYGSQGIGQGIGQGISSINNNMGDPYGRRTDLTYPNQNQNQPSVYSPYQPFNNPNQQPQGSLPTYNHPSGSNYGQMQTSDRLGGSLIGMVPHHSIEKCLMLARPFESSCTDTLVQRQRDAREGRSSNDVQRRICCALFFYRDCLSRIVMERCAESSRVVVDIMMGDRNREISTNCRDYTREQCSGAATNLILSMPMIIVQLILSSILYKLFGWS